jgi:hypothetical protein
MLGGLEQSVRLEVADEFLGQAGWPTPVSCEELEPNCPPPMVLGKIGHYNALNAIANIGHRQDLPLLVSCLLTGDIIGEDYAMRVQIKKGDVAHLSFDEILATPLASCRDAADEMCWAYPGAGGQAIHPPPTAFSSGASSCA